MVEDDTRYDSMQVKLDRRCSNGLLWTNSYTLSRARDYTNDNAAIGTPADVSLSYGLADFDRTHSYVSSFNELPFARNASGAMGRILGGSQVAGVFVAQSGTPVDIRAAGASLRAPQNSSGRTSTGRKTSSATWTGPAVLRHLRLLGPHHQHLRQHDAQRGTARARLLQPGRVVGQAGQDEPAREPRAARGRLQRDQHAALRQPRARLRDSHLRAGDGHAGHRSGRLGPRLIRRRPHDVLTTGPLARPLGVPSPSRFRAVAALAAAARLVSRPCRMCKWHRHRRAMPSADISAAQSRDRSHLNRGWLGVTMDLRQLEMFRAVAEEGSFTAAAYRLHVSQSAVSRQVKLLEEELGAASSWTAAAKGVTLTAAGELLLPAAPAVPRHGGRTCQISETHHLQRGSSASAAA